MKHNIPARYRFKMWRTKALHTKSLGNHYLKLQWRHKLNAFERWEDFAVSKLANAATQKILQGKLEAKRALEMWREEVEMEILILEREIRAEMEEVQAHLARLQTEMNKKETRLVLEKNVYRMAQQLLEQNLSHVIALEEGMRQSERQARFSRRHPERLHPIVEALRQLPQFVQLIHEQQVEIVVILWRGGVPGVVEGVKTGAIPRPKIFYQRSTTGPLKGRPYSDDYGNIAYR